MFGEGRLASSGDLFAEILGSAVQAVLESERRDENKPVICHVKTMAPSAFFEVGGAFLDKVLGLSLKQLRQLRQSTLKLAERYERLFNAPLVPSDIPILWPGSWLFDESLSLWALPHLLRRAAAKVESWPDADYRRWLSDRNLRSYYLALLCVHVSTLTGRPHYEEIASLLTEIARWLKVRGVFDALQIRKDFKAFERRNKDFMWVMHLFAELYQAEDEDPSISFGTRPETVPHGRRE